MILTAILWVLAALGAWLAVALPVAFLLGKAIANAEAEHTANVAAARARAQAERAAS